MTQIMKKTTGWFLKPELKEPCLQLCWQYCHSCTLLDVF